MAHKQLHTQEPTFCSDCGIYVNREYLTKCAECGAELCPECNRFFHDCTGGDEWRDPRKQDQDQLWQKP